MSRKLFSLASLAVLCLIVSAPAYAQTVDEIVAKNIAAKGGEAKLRGIQTLRQTGTINIQGQAASIVTVFKRPYLNRQDITMSGVTITMLFDGEKAWMMNPMMGQEPIAQPAETTEMVKDQADIDGPLFDYRVKGSTVTLVGTEDVNGKKAFHLKVTRKGLPATEVFIDTTTYLDVKSVNEVPGSGTMELAFSDYRSVDGMMVPFTVRNSAAGMMLGELKVDKVEFNVSLPADTFKIKK